MQSLPTGESQDGRGTKHTIDAGEMGSRDAGEITLNREGLFVKNLNSIIVRQASDDFYAFQTAQAMQSLPNVEVVSIVFQDREPIIHGQPRGFWHVFAKFASDQITTDRIDEAIDIALIQDSAIQRLRTTPTEGGC